MNANEALQAAVEAQRIYRSVGRSLHMFHGSCTALDVGSGIDGWGSTLLTLSLDAKRRVIGLFDPHNAGRTGRADPTIRVVRDPVAELPDVHWINYAYVLSHIASHEIHPTINKYRDAYPKAIATVMEYTLRERSPHEALRLLQQSNAETDECASMGSLKFLEQHTRFTPQDLESIFKGCGYGKVRTQSLDRSHSRMFMLGIPTES